jgi:hypothetical protein
MKKIVLSLFLGISLGIANINAQTLSLGVKVEASTSGFILSDMDNMKSRLGPGNIIGTFGIIDFNKHFALRPEILLHHKNSEIKERTTKKETEYKYFGVEVPLYAVAQFTTGFIGKWYVGIGPYVGLGISARYEIDDKDKIWLYKKIENTNKANMQRWDVGAGLLLGYEILDTIQINAGYKVGFLDALDADKNIATMLNHAISIGFAYRFY